jgi:hypothetical protein
VPKADIDWLFNDFIDDRQHAGRDRQFQRLCRFTIEYKFKFCGVKHWQIGGLCALNNVGSVVADEPVSVRQIISITHETTRDDGLSE